MRSSGPKRPGKKSRPRSPPGRKPTTRKRPAVVNAQKDAASEEKEEPLKALTIRLPKSVRVALRRMAKANGRSATKQVEMLIRQADERLQKPTIPTSAANPADLKPGF